MASANPKKSYEVIVNDKDAWQGVKGFIDDKNPGRKPMMLDRYGRAVIHDSGIAKEIRSRYGNKKYGGDGSVTVIPVEDTVGRTRRSAFSVPALPWHKDDT